MWYAACMYGTVDMNLLRMYPIQEKCAEETVCLHCKLVYYSVRWSLGLQTPSFKNSLNFKTWLSVTPFLYFPYRYPFITFPCKTAFLSGWTHLKMYGTLYLYHDNHKACVHIAWCTYAPSMTDDSMYRVSVIYIYVMASLLGAKSAAAASPGTHWVRSKPSA